MAAELDAFLNCSSSEKIYDDLYRFEVDVAFFLNFKNRYNYKKSNVGL